MANNNSNKSKINAYSINILILIVVLIVVVGLGYISLSDKSNKQKDTIKDENTNNMLYNPDNSDIQIAKDKNSLDSLIMYINDYKPRNQTSIIGIVSEVTNFKNLIEESNALAQKYSLDTSFINQVKKMLNLMQQKQALYFPIFRNSYCKIANSLMGEDDIHTIISGDKNNTLELISDRYLDTNNIRIDYSILKPHLELIRYKRIIFRVKNNNEIVKNYMVDSANDNDIH